MDPPSTLLKKIVNKFIANMPINTPDQFVNKPRNVLVWSR